MYSLWLRATNIFKYSLLHPNHLCPSLSLKIPQLISIISYNTIRKFQSFLVMIPMSWFPYRWWPLYELLKSSYELMASYRFVSSVISFLMSHLTFPVCFYHMVLLYISFLPPYTYYIHFVFNTCNEHNFTNTMLW